MDNRRVLKEALPWAVDLAVRRTVDLGAVDLAVYHGVYLAVGLAVYDAGRIRPSHPAIQDFLTEIEAG